MTGGEWAAILTAILVGSSGWITAVLSGRVAVSKSQLEQLSGQFDELVKMFNLVKAENDRMVIKSRDQERRIKELEDLGTQQAAQIEYLQQELDERDGTLAQVKKWAELLVRQLKDNNLDPAPMPDREKTKPRGATT